MSDKPWLNGKPYYCKHCGAGGGERMACEEPDCELEDEQAAKDRKARVQEECLAKSTGS